MTPIETSGISSEDIGITNVATNKTTRLKSLILGSSLCSQESPGIY